MIVVGLAREKLVMIEFKGNHFEREVILWGVCWYGAYPISAGRDDGRAWSRG
jgi:hypothetical protein